MSYRSGNWRRSPKVCSLEGCDQVDIEGKSICQMHRKRMKRTGSYDFVRDCARCAMPFQPKSPMSTYCSPECALEPRAEIVQRSCIECGAPFEPLMGARLCSDACRVARNRAGQKAWSQEHRPPMGKRTSTCPLCGLVFKGYTRQVYCAPRCGLHGSRDARRARERGAFVEAVWRSKVYERDGYVCQICHKPCKMTALAPHPKAPTLDHIIPLAHGGTHEYANVQLAHFLCNSRKSDGDGQLNLNIVGMSA